MVNFKLDCPSFKPGRMMGRVGEVVEELTRQIASNVWRAGDKLPSVRQGAARYGISKNTMSEAYDRLVARGLVLSRPGSGYFVTAERPAPAAPVTPHVTEASSIVSLLREQLDQHYDLRPGDGRPPASWMEGSELRRHMRGTHQGAGEADYGYGSFWGHAPLRDWVRRSLGERSIRIETDGMLLTHGINHGLDLIIRHLLEPGDTVFVDSPGYYPLFGKLRLAKVNAVPIRRLAEGPDLEMLASALEQHRPKIFFTQSQAHNPTGGGLSPAAAFHLLQLAEIHDFRLVEDDVFADLLPASLPRLAAFGSPRVIYLGSFSKTLSASLRCGYVAAEPEITRRLADIKMLTTVATSLHVERLVMDLIDSGQYLRHLRRLDRRVVEATEASVAMLTEAGLELSGGRSGGFYLWARLPAGTDEAAFCKAAAARNIFVAPASVFYAAPDGGAPGMRVNVAYGADPRLHAFLRDYLRP